jgi:phosphoenolpyruvate synthase/pyruvate phosphate dikinase
MDRLASLRDTITAAAIDSVLYRAIITKIELLSKYRRIRFRSSTNAEDLEEFNGAGLYSSKTGIVGDSEEGIERAVKWVWASLWNFRAFEERDYFKIDHRSAAMGVLAHRSFPGELANGVAITKNIYNENIWGHTINVQIGETSVVNPPAGTTSDQIIFYTFYENPYTDPVIEYISHSSITGSKPVLSDAEITLLATHLSSLKTHFYSIYKPWEKGQAYPYFGMDVEFKFDSPDRRLYIKQARWYK